MSTEPGVTRAGVVFCVAALLPALVRSLDMALRVELCLSAGCLDRSNNATEVY